MGPPPAEDEMVNPETHSLRFPLQAFRKFLPLFDRVLVERVAAETVTRGGIMLPEKAQGKVLQATVVAVGPGTTNKVRNIVLLMSGSNPSSWGSTVL